MRCCGQKWPGVLVNKTENRKSEFTVLITESEETSRTLEVIDKNQKNRNGSRDIYQGSNYWELNFGRLI